MLDTIKERVEEGQGETIYELGTGGEYNKVPKFSDTRNFAVISLKFK